MNSTKDINIKLSIICVYVFSVILFLADIFALKWIGWYVQWRFMSNDVIQKMSVTFYAASVFGWFCLWALWKLLHNIKKTAVFIDNNIALLRIISLCCGFAAVIFLISGGYYPPFFLIAVAAAFIMLIVRVIQNIFRQAIKMKSELDLTI